MLVIFLLLQLQFTWQAYIASAFEGVGGASYNTDVAVPSAIPSVSASLEPSNYPSLSPNSISVISTIAGTGIAGYSGDNGQATAATVYGPSGITIDSSENIYFNDYSNCRVRKIAVSTSIITTYAGTGSASYSGDGGVASSASMKYMWGLCMDTSGNLYIADQGNHRIRKVLASTSVISTISGTGTGSYSGDNGQATSATLNNPAGVAVDTSGNVYIGDWFNHRIRKITVSTGVITTIAGTGVSGFSGDGGAATSAKIACPTGINLDSAGNIYFGDEVGYNVIRKVTISTGVISTVAGTGSTTGGYNGDSIQATAASLYYPNDVVLDSYNNLYISDRSNNRVRKVDVSTGVITTLVGTGTYSSTGDGAAATSATMKGPCFTRFDKSGNYYITEGGEYGVDAGSRIRKVTTVTTDIPTIAPSVQPTYYPSLSPHSISVISTIAGIGTGSYSGDNGAATSAAVKGPEGLAIDSSGNVYIADTYNYRIRKITASTGIITTIAGSTTSGSYSGDNGQATSAALNIPTSIAVDSSGNVYIADDYNHRIRKITVSTGIITTFAGTGTNSYSGDNGQAASAKLNYPRGVALDSSGNVYIADQYNQRIRKVTISTGIITTIAGSSTTASFSGDNGQATSAGLSGPRAVDVDSTGNVYIAEYFSKRIRKVTVSTGIITTVAGSSTSTSYSGDNGPATSATLNALNGVSVDTSGNVYIADTYNNCIRKVAASTGIITTYAGSGTTSFSGDGGAATSAGLYNPFGVSVDTSGNVYITDSYNNRIRKVVTVSTDIPTITPSNQPTYFPSLSPHSISIISTIAGTGTSSYSGDNGQATSATLSKPEGLAIDSSGNVYIADTTNNRIRKITSSTGIITTIAGSSTSGSYSGDNGQATSAKLDVPTTIVVDSSGNVYIGDFSNQRIRKVTVLTGIITTIAGSSSGYSGDNGQATLAKLNYPRGVALDSSGNVYIADQWNNRIRKVTVSTGIITTIAGSSTSGSYSGDNGQATSAGLNGPRAVDVDSTGNVYIADDSNQRIRKVTVFTGIITTVAGSSTSGGYSGDNGLATSAKLNGPQGVSVDSAGNVYIADCYNHRIRKVTVSTGIIVTYAGTGTGSFSGDGSVASSATLYSPYGVAVDTSGNVYIADSSNNRIRKVVTVSTNIPTAAPSYTPSATPTIVPSTASPSIQPTYYPSLSPHSISIISTIAGTGTASYSGDGSQATSSALNGPHGIAVDSSGNVFIGDGSFRVRKITASTGVITTYAGTGSTTYNGDGGAASSAAITFPHQLCLDSSGNLYITDFDIHRIRKVLASTSIISTIAGTGSTSFSGDNGPATSATLNYPVGVAVDTSGNVYIGDCYNHRIRKITVSTSGITTIAGTGTAGYDGDGGAATAAAIKYPGGINLDSSLNVYFGDRGAYNIIRKVTISTGVISTVAGTGSTGYNGDNIQATAATLNAPLDVVLDSSGNLYICDRSNYRIRKVDVSTGIITTFVGTGTASSTGDGSAATSATIKGACFSRIDSSGTLYITECDGNRVRKVVTVTTDIPTATPTFIPSTSVPSVQPTYYPSLSPHSISVISTIAGTGTASYSGDGGAATSATLNGPLGIVIDSSGNVYFSDFNNHRVRKVTALTGIITTYAGIGSASFSGDGGVASSAALCNPNGLSIDSSGNMYIAEYGNNRIRRVLASTSVVSTVAGTGTAKYSGDNGQATSATLNYPTGVAVDTSGNVYISDNHNHRIRKVAASTNVITTIAGTGNEGYSGDNSQATAANIKNPHGINLDSTGNVYFGDSVAYNVIRKITVSTGIISTVAGTGSASGSYNGDNIQATAATLYYPHDVVLDSSGNLYISDRYNYRIRKVTVSTGVISTVVGTGTASSTGDGSAATAATINGPCYSRFDSSGNYYIADCDGYKVRKVVTVSTDIPTATPSIQPTSPAPSVQPTYYPSLSPHSISVISTIAGTGTGSYSGDNGQATSATINCPTGIVIDSSGNVYFNDFRNHRVRKITVLTGIITTYAGTGSSSFNGDNVLATSAALNWPNGLSIDTSGNLYITDYGNHRIRKVTASTSVISTIAGTGTASYSGDNGQATSATINYPIGVAVDTSGNVYIGDYGNHRVRKITASTGVITTIAGTGVAGYSGDNGQATAAAIKYPCGIDLDSAANVYFGDYLANNVIRKVTVSTGIISTVAGNGGTGYNGDNIQATAAKLSNPHDVVLDSSGNLYISDRANNRIRKVTVATGVITTVVGTGTSSSTGDGSAATSATINGPCFSRFDSSGNYYISECEGSRVRKVVTVSTDIPTITPSNQPTYFPSLSPHSISVISTIAGTGSGGYSGDNGQATSATVNVPGGIAIDSSGNVYFNDYCNHRVRKITTSTGIITTYAGTGASSYSGDGVVATSAALNLPNGLCMDASGNIYIADQNNYRIRKVTASTNIISTIAGTGALSYSGDNGLASSAAISNPAGVAVDSSGNLYISDTSNHRVRKVMASTSVITTIAGIGSAGYSGNNGQATAAAIYNPQGINLDISGNVYFGDCCGGYNVVRKITVSTGVISTVAGTGSASGGYNGDNIQATAAMLNTPQNVVFDVNNNLYISDQSNNRIRKVDLLTGVITTVIGTGTASSTGDGSAATSATINGPCYSRFDSAGNYYISESGGNRVRKVMTVTTDIPTSAPSMTPSTMPTFVPSTAIPSLQPTYYPSLSPHSISVISTIAGTGVASYSGDNGQATSAAINVPTGIALDSSGNVYFSDWGNHRVRKITASTGIITTYAGTGAASYSGDGSKATSAALNAPYGLCIDTSGNVYIADFGNNRIRKVLASTSVISTIAGTGSASFSGDNGQATSATLNAAEGVAVDTSGNVYIGDYGNHRVRKITASTGIITTIAGTGTAGYSGDGGAATAGMIKNPIGVNLDSSLNVYFGDISAYNVIRKVTISTGVISTVAGISGNSGYNGDNIQATAATLNNPHDVVLDSYNNLYIGDRGNNRVRKVDVSTGVITTVVGTGIFSSTGDGFAASSATIKGVCASRFDSAGNYYITECGAYSVNDGSRIRKVMTVTTDIPTPAPSYTPSATPTFTPSTSTPSIQPTYYPSLSPHSISVISTIAGTGSAGYSGDGGQATSATINQPAGIVIDSSGNVYFSEFSNHRVRKITSSTGVITTYAGTGSASYSGDNGLATSAALNNPNGLSTDSSGNLYIAEYGNHRIRKVTASSSVISTIAGTGTASYSGDNGQATSATLYQPRGVAVDTSGNVYIGDGSNHRVRKITASTGVITTIAGTGSYGYSGDGGAATAAAIAYPAGVNLDSAGNLYFGDGYNLVRKVTVSTGIISTVAGTGSTSGAYNGDNIQATAASLNNPHDVVLDSYGNLFISDRFNYRIRKVDVSTGVITNIVGTGTASSTGDGSAATSATIKGPCYSRFDTSGNYYISECEGNRVRKVVTVTTEIPTAAPSYSPSVMPTSNPTFAPSNTPSKMPSVTPTKSPTMTPSTAKPTIMPSMVPSVTPTHTPSMSPTEYPTYLNGVEVYFTVTQLFYNVSYSLYAADKAVNDALIIAAVVEAIGYDLRETDVTVTSSSKHSRVLSSAAMDTLSMSYYVDSVSYIFADADTATQVYMQALEAAISNGTFSHLLYEYAVSKNSTLVSSTHTSAVLNTAGPTSSPSSSPTTSPTKAPVNLLGTNILSAELTAEVVKEKTNYYLAYYLAYFLCIYVLLYLFSLSRLGVDAATRLYDSAYESGNFSKCTSELVAAPENSEVNYVLRAIYERNQRVHDTLIAEAALLKIKSAKTSTSADEDIEDESEDRMSKTTQSSRRVSFNSRLLKLMLKNKEKFSAAFQEYIMQNRTLLGSSGILFPAGYSVRLCGRTYTFPVGVMENLLLFVCINHALFNCFYYVKGSKLGRHGTKLVYICREIVVFVLSQFVGLMVEYLGISGTGTRIFTNIFLVVPLAQSIGMFLVYIYTCPCADSIEFQSKYTRLHGYLLLLGRIALIPILLLIFLSLVVACIFSTSTQRGRIIGSYLLNVQILGVVKLLVTCVLRFIDDYYFEVLVYRYQAISVGGMYLERIVHHNLKNEVDFTTKKVRWLCGLVTVLTITAGGSSTTHHEEMEEEEEVIEEVSEYVAIEMTTHSPLIEQHDEDDNTTPAVSVEEDVVEVVRPEEDESDYVDYGNIYNTETNEEVVQYNDMATVRTSVQHGQKSKPPASAAAKIDVDNMSLADLLKQYKLERVQQDDKAGHDDRLFEEWKMSKRKQFKEGTRSAFVDAYNTYEDLFSKTTYQSTKGKEAYGVTVNPLLAAGRKGTTTGDQQSADSSMDSAAHTKMLFQQQSGKSKISLDHKYKKK